MASHSKYHYHTHDAKHALSLNTCSDIYDTRCFMQIDLKAMLNDGIFLATCNAILLYALRLLQTSEFS
jgi:hypothetical protein